MVYSTVALAKLGRRRMFGQWASGHLRFAVLHFVVHHGVYNAILISLYFQSRVVECSEGCGFQRVVEWVGV